MAVMIPRTYPKETPSGEKEWFRLLKNDPATEEWVVLHSLDLAQHVSQLEGEADFVIIVPNRGVLVLEVKSHDYVKVDHNGWWLGRTNPEPERRGPFKQASRAMYSIINYIKDNAPDFRRTMFRSAVSFTGVPFDTKSPEWHPWQIVDKRLLSLKPVSEIVISILDNAKEHAAVKGRSFSAYDKDNSLNLARCLRPFFEILPSKRSHRKELERELTKFTEEQFIALDAMADNPRTIFHGPAGCGKTVLAMESARRAEESALGMDTLFLCYNRLLGEKMASDISEVAPSVCFSNMDKFLINKTSYKPSDTEANTPDFWSNKLPKLIIDKLLNNEIPKYKYLILDEAQDLFRKQYIEIFDLILEGGLAGGRWAILGDFENQDIYSKGEVDLDTFMDKYGQERTASYRLTVNCRNTPEISEWVQILGNMTPGYSRVLRPSEQPDPHILFFEDNEDQCQKVINWLGELELAGFSINDCVLLHPAGITSVVEQLKVAPEWNKPLKAYNGEYDCLQYTSIQKFKGLEAPVVLITDLHKLDSQYMESLFYIGMSRALHCLCMFAHEELKKPIGQRI